MDKQQATLTLCIYKEAMLFSFNGAMLIFIQGNIIFMQGKGGVIHIDIYMPLSHILAVNAMIHKHMMCRVQTKHANGIHQFEPDLLTAG